VLPPIPALRLKRTIQGLKRRYEVQPENMVGEVVVVWVVGTNVEGVEWSSAGKILSLQLPEESSPGSIRILARAKDEAGLVAAVQEML
jgi:hypothetical protein